MDRYQQLLKALEDTNGTGALIEYWEDNHSSDIKFDLQRLAKAGMPQSTDNDLKAFTMAAMQGLLANSRKEDTDVVIADLAVAFARATLTELSKQQ